MLVLEASFRNSVGLLKQRYGVDYCSHGCRLPLNLRAKKEHAKAADRLRAQAKELLAKARAMNCKAGR